MSKEQKEAPKIEEKSNPKNNPKVEVKTESKLNSKANSTMGSKPEAKPDSKANSKTEAKPDAKPDSKANSKAESKPEAKPDSKANSKTGSTTETTPDAKAKTDLKTEEKDAGVHVASNLGFAGDPGKQKRLFRRIVYTLEVAVLLTAAIVLFLLTKVERIHHATIKEEQLVKDSVSQTVQESAQSGSMRKYTTIAFFGVDTRKGELESNTRTDSIILVSINQDTGKVRMASVYRDTFLNTGNGFYNKANSAYSNGGPEQALRMLNMNLDLNVTDFVTVGFGALADTIDALGGVDVDVEEAEIKYLNDYGTIMGKQQKREFVPVTEPGMQTLDGLQATAYCRIRYTAGDDYRRTERQRLVLSKMFEKARRATPAQLNTIANSVFGEMYTSLTLSELLSYVADAGKYSIVGQTGFPDEEHREGKNIRAKGSVVVPETLYEAVIQLHSFLYEDESYVPSNEVQEISDAIEEAAGGKKTPAETTVTTPRVKPKESTIQTPQTPQTPQTQPSLPQGDPAAQIKAMQEAGYRFDAASGQWIHGATGLPYGVTAPQTPQTPQTPQIPQTPQATPSPQVPQAAQTQEQPAATP